MGRTLRLVLLCGFVMLTVRGVARAEDDWRVHGALTALGLSDDALVAPAVRALAARKAKGALDVILERTAPLHTNADVRAALALALGELQVDAERSLPRLLELFALDGFRPDSAACDALERWRESPGAITAERASRMVAPGDADPADWYACVGLWNQVALDAVLALPSERFRASMLTGVVAAQRPAAAAKVLAIVGDATRPLELRVSMVTGLGYLQHGAREVLGALDRAADDAKLHRAAVAAISRLLPSAPAGAIAERRLVRWTQERPQWLDEDSLASFARASELVRQVWGEQLAKDVRACPASRARLRRVSGALADYRGELPAALVNALREGLTSGEPKARACAANVATWIVDRTPSLHGPLAEAMRQLDPDDVDTPILASLIRAGEAAALTSELLDYYRDFSWAVRDPVGDAVASAKLAPDAAARLSTALLARLTVPSQARWVDRAAPVLWSLGKVGRADALKLIERTYDGAGVTADTRAELRFWAIALSGADATVVAAARWLAFGASSPERLEPDEARGALTAAVQILAAAPGPKVSRLARALVRDALNDTAWRREDVAFLRAALVPLPADVPARADLVAAAERQLARLAPPPSTPWYASAGRWAFALVGLHFVAWLAALLLIYPRSRLAQTMMLFNPIGRKVTGLWYTQALLLVSHRLRQRLFRPLVDEADPEMSFDEESFFAKVRVVPIRQRPNPQAPHEEGEPQSWATLAALPGLVVIEGASGFGKTHVQRALLARARAAGKTCLFVRASECEDGVVKLIEQRLKIADGGAFVGSLLHRGAIELFLDGLNEAQPKAINEIALFCARAPNARIVVSTQPLQWACPSRARRFRLLPLEPEEFQDFLLAQWPAVRDPDLADTEQDAALAAYRERAHAFLQGRTSARELAVLQNRIDLAFVAHLLARAQVPNIHSLRRQVVDAAARAYEASSPGGVFPLAALAAAAVRVLETGNPVIAQAELDPAVFGHLLVRKLVLQRGGKDWLFRHDTITCYFAAQGYFAPLIRAREIDPGAVTRAHLSSKRFSGVYLQLAESLPLEAAERLAEALRDHGRESGDRSLEIEVQDILDRRARERTPTDADEPPRQRAQRAP
ncbi:MAG: hypothetical protein R3B48_15140 [Kofleriaceae bacterium]